MRVQINTTRQYTDEGQIIVIECEREGIDPNCGVDLYVVNFHDVSRMISGVIHDVMLCEQPWRVTHELAHDVMHRYDRGLYKHTCMSDAPRLNRAEPITTIRL